MCGWSGCGDRRWRSRGALKGKLLECLNVGSQIGQIDPSTGIAATNPEQVDSDFTGDAGHLRGERAELVHHGVDGVLQLEDLALDVHGDLLRQVAVGDGGGDLGDVAHLAGEVAGHEVHVVGQVLPGAGHALHVGLAAQLAFGAHLARHARDFAGEGVELGDSALIWKSTATLPRNDYAEASLPTLRWQGRMQPPMKVSALVRLTRDAQGALIGIEAGEQRNRIVFNAKSFPGVVAVGSVFTAAEGRFSVAPASRVAIDLSQPVRVEAVIDDRRRLTLSWNGNVVDRDRQIGEGPIGWIFQLYQMEGASQIAVEALTIDGIWVP